jgi:putative endonuclease
MDIHVYMLRCADGSYYVGLTRAGIAKRLAEHNDGVFDGYTSRRRPVTLVWSQDFLVLTQAIACERRLKGWRREKKEAVIRGDYEALRSLSRTAKMPGSGAAPCSSTSSG